MKKNHSLRIILMTIFLTAILFHLNVSAEPFKVNSHSDDGAPGDEEINLTFSILQEILPNGTSIEGLSIGSSPNPPPEYEAERQASIMELPIRGIITDFPSYSWVFGCSAVSGAMIAAYYDQNGFGNIYTGPTNGGVMPLTDTSWSTWFDGYVTYPNNPLVASHNGVDGRSERGTIDDYWVSNESLDDDPFITNGWVEHAWGTAIGDFMKTSQSNYHNKDGSTLFYRYTDGTMTPCSEMENIDSPWSGMYASDIDGTYGRKEFYEARGYFIGDCYNQKTDNNGVGFTLADFQAEIDMGHPVLINLVGHSIVGYGYSGSTIYIRDTWDSNPENTYTMTWGGSYSGKAMDSVSIVHPLLTAPPTDQFVFLPVVLNGPPPAIELIENGDFEQGLVAWERYSNHEWDVISEYPGLAHGGDWLAWLGGWYDDTSYISQDVTISPEMPYLHYWFWAASVDDCGSDIFRINVGATTVLTQELCSSQNTGGYIEGVLDLSGYTGSPQNLKFESITDAADNSNLYLDDVFFSSSSSTSGEIFLPIEIEEDAVFNTRTE